MALPDTHYPGRSIPRTLSPSSPFYFVLMQPDTDDLVGLNGRCISYPSTTPGQRTQAVFWVAGELDDQFSGLSLGKWGLAFQKLQPDLWEEDGRVRLDQEDLARFTDYLANALLIPDPTYPFAHVRATWPGTR